MLLAAGMVFLSACGILPFEDKTLKTGKVGTEYSDTIATGTKDMYYDLDYDSTMPDGLVLYDDGSIKGVPEQAGDFSFKAVMIDMNDVEYYANFSLHIDKGELVYTASNLESGKTNEPYSVSVATATGMPVITYALKEGSTLPAGLTLAEDGTLAGIPTEVAENRQFTVVASAEGCDPAEAVFTVTIERGEQVIEDLGYIVFEDFTLPEGTVGEEYSQHIRRAYGVPNISYAIRFKSGQGLPSGLKATPSLGTITGTPKDRTEGMITFTVTASAEGCESVKANVSLTVNDKYVETTKFETEYVDSIPSLTGNGYSDSKAGKGMIQNCPNMSNGRSLGFLNKPNDIVYKITAQSDTKAQLVLGLGSEVGDYTYDNTRFKILVNGVEVNYGKLNVRQTGTAVTNFASTPLTVSPLINLTAGENTITFKILAADDAPGTFSAWGCLFDYIELNNASCTLGWYPRVGNLS